MEMISITGLRTDGRRPREVRRGLCEMGINKATGVDGSANFELGSTKVIAFVQGPMDNSNASSSASTTTTTSVMNTAVSLSGQMESGSSIAGTAVGDAAVITCDVTFTAFSSVERKRRGPNDRKSLDISQAVVDTLNGIVQTYLFRRSLISITIFILQADGGVLPACINAAVLALIDAGIPMDDFISCCAAGQIDSTNLVDLNGNEESYGRGPVVWCSYSPRWKRVITMNMVGKVPLHTVTELTDLAIYGCEQISLFLHQQVLKRTNDIRQSHKMLERHSNNDSDDE